MEGGEEMSDKKKTICDWPAQYPSPVIANEVHTRQNLLHYLAQTVIAEDKLTKESITLKLGES